MRFGPLNDGHPGAPRLEATVVGSGPAWISTNGRTIKGTWKKTGAHEADPVLRREGQRGHADRRPDLRPGHDHEHDRLPGLVQGRLRARRRPPPVPSRRRPPAERSGAGVASAVRGDADLGVDRPGLARDVGPGPALPVSARSRAAAATRSWTPSSAQTVRQRDGEALRVARLDQEPGRPDELGQRPDRRRDDRRPAGDRLDAGRPAASETTGRIAARAPRTRPGEPRPGRLRRVGEDSPIPFRAAARASAARSSGLAPTSRTRGGQADRPRRARRAARPRPATPAPAAACRGPGGRRNRPV